MIAEFDRLVPRMCYFCGMVRLISLMSWFPAHEGYVVAVCDNCLREEEI